MLTLARARAQKTGRPYGLIGPDGHTIVTTGGDIVSPKIRTGTVPPQVAAARAKFSTGSGCGCGPNSGCPTPAQLQDAANRGIYAGQIAHLSQRTIPGRGGKCDYAPLSFGADVLAGATAVLNQNSSVLICPEKMVIVTTDVLGFRITNLRFGNRPQFAELVAGRGLHSSTFAPDAVQAIPFKGDCLDSGAPFQLTAVNLDAANPQNFDGYLIGPMQGM
jgi:hypothetical protein